MEIRQQFTINRDIDCVWRALSDIRLVASCMPGAEIVSVSADQRQVDGRIRAKVGPISAAFAGQGKITRDESNHTGSVEGTGMDKNNGSRAQVKLTYALRPGEDGRSTVTSIVAGVTLSGLLAQFGKGALINEIAAQMTKEFAQELQQRLEYPSASAAVNGVSVAPSTRSAPPNSLDPLKLLLAVLKTRIANLFRRSAGQNGHGYAGNPRSEATRQPEVVK
jgi:carbon monoxide dehydrogenase subunit G